MSDANERLDAREEELMNLEEKVAKANNQYRQIQSELKEAKLRAKDLETRLEEEKNTRVASHISGELAQLHAEYDALKLKHSQALEKVETLQVLNYYAINVFKNSTLILSTLRLSLNAVKRR